MIQAFQEANREALPDSLEFRRGRLVADQERLLQFDRDEALLRERRAALVAHGDALVLVRDQHCDLRAESPRDHAGGDAPRLRLVLD